MARFNAAKYMASARRPAGVRKPARGTARLGRNRPTSSCIFVAWAINIWRDLCCKLRTEQILRGTIVVTSATDPKRYASNMTNIARKTRLVGRTLIALVLLSLTAAACLPDPSAPTADASSAISQTRGAASEPTVYSPNRRHQRLLPLRRRRRPLPWRQRHRPPSPPPSQHPPPCRRRHPRAESSTQSMLEWQG